MTKKSHKGVYFRGGFVKRLSKEQADIKRMLVNEFMTPKQIAIRRGTTIQATYKTIRKLKEKGEINKIFRGVEKNRPTSKPPLNTKNDLRGNSIRLHGQEFNIRILHKSKTYETTKNKTNLIYIDDNTIKLNNKTIEIYSGHSFFSDSVHKATSKSLMYWNRLFTKIENELDIILIKNRVENIRLVNNHYSEINNELAKETEIKGDKIRIYANEDGKLWFSIDNSFNLHEMETLHPKTAQEDMENIKPFFNDLRENEKITISDLKNMIYSQAKVNKETADGLAALAHFMKSQLPKTPEIDQNTPKSKPEYVG